MSKNIDKIWGRGNYFPLYFAWPKFHFKQEGEDRFFKTLNVKTQKCVKTLGKNSRKGGVHLMTDRVHELFQSFAKDENFCWIQNFTKLQWTKNQLRIYFGSNQISYWNKTWYLIRINLESTWNQCEIHSESIRNWLGINLESTWKELWVKSESTLNWLQNTKILLTHSPKI